MIPLKDDNPGRRIPWVNLLLIATNLGVFGYQFFYLPKGSTYLIKTFGVVPHALFGSNDIGTVPLTLFSAMFIHADWLHLLGNMLYLWIFGDNVEDRLGHGRYLVFYLACGVLAAYLLFFPKARVTTLFIVFIFFRIVRLPAMVLLGLWIALQVASGISELSARAGGVAWFAHLGGFAAGAILALTMRPQHRRGSAH